MKAIKMKGKALAILISLAMVFTMMPLMDTQVHAEDPASDPAAINLVVDGKAPEIKGAQASSIYFGSYPQSQVDSLVVITQDVDYIQMGLNYYLIEPIKWRVLDNKKVGAGEYSGELLMLSDKLLEKMAYLEYTTGKRRSATWEESTIRSWLNGYGSGSNVLEFDYTNDNFIGKAFSQREQGAIPVTQVRNKKTDDYTPNPEVPEVDGGEDTEDKVFLLSFPEAVNEDYGFAEDYDIETPTRRAVLTDYVKAKGAEIGTGYPDNGFWWLRSPGANDTSPALVLYDGGIYPNDSDISNDIMQYTARPAFNLDMSSAVLTSAAEGGKTSGEVGAGALEEVGTNPNDEWKLTLESGHESFKVETVATCDEKMLNIEYSGAVTNKGEFISAIITDEYGAVKYYGNLVEFNDGDKTSGIAEVDIEGKMEPTDHLYIFNEQLNGDRKTDYSSSLKEVEVPEKMQSIIRHIWDAGKMVKPATTKEEGEKLFTCRVCGVTRTENIPKLAMKANTLKVSGRTATIKYSKLKKKNQTIKRVKAITVTKPQGKLSYKKSTVAYTKAKSVKMSKKAMKKYKKQAAKKILINAKTGNVTVKKGLKKGTYKVKVKVKASGNVNYKASAWKIATFKVIVK